jgi:hypothetical protein
VQELHEPLISKALAKANKAAESSQYVGVKGVNKYSSGLIFQ